MPDGNSVEPEQPGASEIISSILGHPLRLENCPHADEQTSFDKRTVFGDVPVSAMKPDWTPEPMPDYFQLKSGSFFEIGAVFVLASGSVDHLRHLQGGTALIDRRRFRPNLYLDTGSGPGGFVEDAWLEGTLSVGDRVRLNRFAPTLWCVTSTLAQEELPATRPCCGLPRSTTAGVSGCTAPSHRRAWSASAIRSCCSQVRSVRSG